ncbi:hypothetical protein [Thalassomonas actiniarum]|uniref:Uncharacterized protein n=1 Tax=Thalassomonas actiniarum TaxID=485447 RepID=A0AAE9YTM2_9GAMM|nr:hypothetical protein [Thalassomonas actiniarum]WDD99386.1 hypothetical protein SG35_001470 [Thalassomonas actiniarum]
MNNKHTPGHSGSETRYLLPRQLSAPFCLDPQTLCSINSEDNHCFIVIRLDRYLLFSTRLPQPCRFGDVKDDICVLIGNSSLFFSTDTGGSFTEIAVPLEPEERLGKVKIDRQEIIVRLFQMKKHPTFGLQPRLLCLSLSGDLIWQTRFPVVNEKHILVCSANLLPEDLPRTREQEPRYWLPGVQELLISDHILMVSYADYATTGLGAWYAIHTGSGRLLWQSRSEPLDHTTALSDGRFILGTSGYGAFDSYLFAAENNITNHWPANGPCFKTGEGRLMLLQSGDSSSDHQQLLELAPEGSLMKHNQSFPDGNHHIAKLLQLAGDKIFFWRNHSLWSWQTKQGLSKLIQVNTQSYLVKLLALSPSSFALIYNMKLSDSPNIHIFNY